MQNFSFFQDLNAFEKSVKNLDEIYLYILLLSFKEQFLLSNDWNLWKDIVNLIFFQEDEEESMKKKKHTLDSDEEEEEDHKRLDMRKVSIFYNKYFLKTMNTWEYLFSFIESIWNILETYSLYYCIFDIHWKW